MIRKSSRSTEAFTIVELLIVIVVIGILAAITIVSFNGVSAKARIAGLQSTLVSSAKAIENARTVAGTTTYPTTAPSGLDPAISYTSNTTLGGYCATKTDTGLTYMVTQSNPTPHPGPSSAATGCSVTNMIASPSFEVNSTVWGTGTRAVLTATTAYGAVAGTSAGLLTKNSATANEGYIGQLLSTTVGKRYSVSFSVRSGNAAPMVKAAVVNYNQSWSIADSAYIEITPTATFTRYTLSWTAQDTGSLFYIENTSTVSTNSSIVVDAVIATEGENAGSYVDPDYKPGSGWSWTGTAVVSTSTGPAF